MKCTSRSLDSFIVVLILTVFASADGPGYHVTNTFQARRRRRLGLSHTRQRFPAPIYIQRHACDCDECRFRNSRGRYSRHAGSSWNCAGSRPRRGFVSNGREGTVTIFDLKSLKLISKVKIGENPDAILYDPSTKRVFTLTAEVTIRPPLTRQTAMCSPRSNSMETRIRSQ